MIVEDDNTVKIYYGASDNCIALAETTVEELVEYCFNSTEYQKTTDVPHLRHEKANMLVNKFYRSFINE